MTLYRCSQCVYTTVQRVSAERHKLQHEEYNEVVTFSEKRITYTISKDSSSENKEDAAH
jgi:hypothetical protein